MHNLISRRTADKQRDRFNANLFEQSLSAQIYNRWLTAENFYDIATTPSASWDFPDNDNPPAWSFTGTGRRSVGLYVGRSREWRHGIVTFAPHLMFEDSSGDVVAYCMIIALKDLDLITAWPTSGTTYDKVITATGTPYQLYATPSSIYLSDNIWTAEVDDSTVGLQICFGRNGGDAADTNSGDLLFLGGWLKYIEGEKSIGELYDPIRR